jgi:cysteine desulfurase
MIYLDNNATTTMSSGSIAVMTKWLNRGNPSAGYPSAVAAREMMEKFRSYLRAITRGEYVGDIHVIFTSGGSESNATAINHIAAVYPRSHVVATAYEHKSVLLALESFSARGLLTYTLVKPRPDGHIHAADIAAAATSNTSAIFCMHANNETGAINDLRAIGAFARARGILLHTDAVQTFGKYPPRLSTGVTSMAASFHKFGGPTGVGVFISTYPPVPLIFGTQNEGARGGTENLAGIAAAYAATSATMRERAAKNAAVRALKKHMMNSLGGISYAEYRKSGLDRGLVYISEDSDFYLGNTLLLSVVGPDVCNVEIKKQLLARRIVVSVGSACNTASDYASHVLDAIDASTPIKKGAIRVSLGDLNTRADADGFLREFSKILTRL